MQIALYHTDTAADRLRIQQLAKQLQLPITPQAEHLCVLRFIDDKLALCAPAHKPLYCDFLQSSFQKRCQQASFKTELLLRAIYGKNSAPETAIDATAGFGEDSVLLAMRGLKMTLIERNPIVAALLADGLGRLKMHSLYQNLAITLVCADAHAFLSEHISDVIYLDPMYAPRKNTALNQLRFRVLHDLVGDNADAASLLPLARQNARLRVVVKRPRLAAPLNDESPQHSHVGKAIRFDVYK